MALIFATSLDKAAAKAGHCGLTKERRTTLRQLAKNIDIYAMLDSKGQWVFRSDSYAILELIRAFGPGYVAMESADPTPAGQWSVVFNWPWD